MKKQLNRVGLAMLLLMGCATTYSQTVNPPIQSLPPLPSDIKGLKVGEPVKPTVAPVNAGPFTNVENIPTQESIVTTTNAPLLNKPAPPPVPVYRLEILMSSSDQNHVAIINGVTYRPGDLLKFRKFTKFMDVCPHSRMLLSTGEVVSVGDALSSKEIPMKGIKGGDLCKTK